MSRNRQTTLESNPTTNALLIEDVKFVPAPEVEKIAQELIAEIHGKRWFTVPRIVYLFRSEAEKVRGATALATCRKVSGLNAYLMELAEVQAKEDPDDFNRRQFIESFESPDKYDLPTDRHVLAPTPFYVISVHHSAWLHRLDDKQKRALVDHELMHIDVELGDKDVKYGTRPHDTEEFIEIVQRYGAWEPGVAMLVKAAEDGPQFTRAHSVPLAPGIDSITISPGGKSVTLGKPAKEEDAAASPKRVTKHRRATHDASDLPIAQEKEEESTPELEEVPLRVFSSLFQTILLGKGIDAKGEGGTVFRHGGSHYIVDSIKEDGSVTAFRIKMADLYPGETKDFWSFANSFTGSVVTDTEGEKWVIVSDTVYNVTTEIKAEAA